MRPPYPRRFRNQTIELLRKGRFSKKLAKVFEPTETAIRSWLKHADHEDRIRSDGRTTEEEEEIRPLRKKLRAPDQDWDVLAKAAAWFSQETKITAPKSSDS